MRQRDKYGRREGGKEETFSRWKMFSSLVISQTLFISLRRYLGWRLWKHFKLKVWKNSSFLFWILSRFVLTRQRDGIRKCKRFNQTILIDSLSLFTLSATQFFKRFLLVLLHVVRFCFEKQGNSYSSIDFYLFQFRIRIFFLHWRVRFSDNVFGRLIKSRHQLSSFCFETVDWFPGISIFSSSNVPYDYRDFTNQTSPMFLVFVILSFLFRS